LTIITGRGTMAHDDSPGRVSMVVPIRNAYVQRVAGSRIAAGARNVAKMPDASEPPDIEIAAESKRTGAQEESLLHEGSERFEAATEGKHGGTAALHHPGEQLTSMVEQSLRWNEKLRAATEAYRNTIDRLDQDNRRTKPGDVYDVPL
jgi:hypothetical protein